MTNEKVTRRIPLQRGSSLLGNDLLFGASAFLDTTHMSPETERRHKPPPLLRLPTVGGRIADSVTVSVLWTLVSASLNI